MLYLVLIAVLLYLIFNNDIVEHFKTSNTAYSGHINVSSFDKCIKDNYTKDKDKHLIVYDTDSDEIIINGELSDSDGKYYNCLKDAFQADGALDFPIDRPNIYVNKNDDDKVESCDIDNYCCSICSNVVNDICPNALPGCTAQKNGEFIGIPAEMGNKYPIDTHCYSNCMVSYRNTL